MRTPRATTSRTALGLLAASALACSSGSGGDSTETPQNSGLSGSAVVSLDPAPPAPASVIDPNAAWSALGELSGKWAIEVEWLEDDCSFGPDVPPVSHPTSAGSAAYSTTRGDVHTYRTYATQRGGTLAFELGEGIVYARWDESAGRLADVWRLAGDGQTEYLDGFAVDTSGVSPTFAGESAWRFEDAHYVPGEVCTGRTRWSASRTTEALAPGARDFQIVLRWDAASRADLDLTVLWPDEEDEEDEIDFAQANRDCYVTHATGRAIGDDAGPHDDFVSRFEDTTLPYHEEVVRCVRAKYDWWDFFVTNFADTPVDYELEVFWGPGVNTTRNGERSFGAFAYTVDGLDREWHQFRLDPPNSSTGSFGLVSITSSPYLPRGYREEGPITDTYLEYHKAGFEDVEYADFLDALGF